MCSFVWSRSESSGAVQNRVIQSRLESFGIFWSRSELPQFIQIRPESSGVIRSHLESSRGVRNRLESESSGRIRTTPIPKDSDSGRLRKISDNSRRRRTTSDDSGWLRTIPDRKLQTILNGSTQFRAAQDDSESLQIMLGELTFWSYRSRMGVNY